jgi:hypothetical protein
MIKQGSPTFKPNGQQSSEPCRVEDLVAKLKDPHFLPSFSELSEQLNQLSFNNQKPWLELINDPRHRVFEFLTKEYVNALSGYLSLRAFELGGTPENPITILEVGAGNGRLSHFLTQSLAERSEGRVKLIAVDSGEWDLDSLFQVERLDHQAALSKYQPQMVIFSWMPPNQDYTKDFRQAPSVQEYVLIGEADENTCGDPWETWGKAQMAYDEDVAEVKWIAPHEADGFVRHEHEELRNQQLSRLSIVFFLERSTTVSFIRSEKGGNID